MSFCDKKMRYFTVPHKACQSRPERFDGPSCALRHPAGGVSCRAFDIGANWPQSKKPRPPVAPDTANEQVHANVGVAPVIQDR